MCSVVKAISAQDEKLAQTMFLPLAERMVEKMVKEDKIEAEAEASVNGHEKRLQRTISTSLTLQDGF